MTVDPRVLNRTSLRRQLLLERSDLPVTEAVHHLVGLQGQVPAVPYLALWSRLAGFQPEQLSSLMADRALVRSPLMRTTIHTVTADDALGLWPLVAPVLQRTFASTSWGQALRGQDLDDVLQRCVALVDEQPLTRSELAQRLDHALPTEVSWAFGYLVAHVQATPRGLWRQSGRSALTTTQHWLGRPLSAHDVTTVVSRYLAAFGPATVKDVQAWCGLTRLREVTDGMDLRRWPDGLLDLPDAELADPDLPAPVRFLPEYDNALLGYADRSRWSSGHDQTWLQGGPGGHVGSVLVDGRVRATWAARRKGGLEVRASPRLRDEAAVEAEARALLDLLAPGSDAPVRFT